MARPKDKIRSVRVRLDGYLKPGVDAKVDELLARLGSLPPRSKFPTVIGWLITGSAVTAIPAETSDEETLRMVREAESAAEAFFNRYGGDDE